jgi:ribonuclease HI
VEAVKQGWIWKWEKKDFSKKANPDLWKRFIPLYHTYKPKFKWIKGHAGHPENERCDVLAVQAAQSPDVRVDDWYENNRG